MATVNFIIKGLAVCYRKETDPEVWNIVFPMDEKHKANFSYIKNGEKEEVGDLYDSGITISSRTPDSHIGTEPPTNYEDPSFTRYVIDLTSEYLHSDGLIRRPLAELNDLEVKERKLQIRHATLFSEDERKDRLNYVFPFNDYGGIKLIKDAKGQPQIFSKLVGGEINLKPNAEIIITIDGKDPIYLTARDSFYIDNDCSRHSERNDFQLYQDIFRSKNLDNDTRFEMISISKPNKVQSASNSTKNLSEIELKTFLVTDPPPLICDTVRVSNPSDIE